MNLRDIDLNLLVIFNELLNTGRVQATADRVGLTQSAVSNALARLRSLLGDELFIRTPTGMQPTAYAQELGEPVAYALASIHGALNQVRRFDPLQSRKRFTIAMTDIGEIHFLPELMEQAGRLAPHVSISTVRNLSLDLAKEMETGGIDLAFGHLPHLQTGFLQRQLFPQNYVCLFRQDSRFNKDSLSLKDFMEAEHIGIAAEGTGHAMINDLFAKMGIERKIKLYVPHFIVVGHILAATDMIATVPQILAMRLCEPFGLSWKPHPVKLPEISVGLFWHAKVHRSLENRWLRDLIFGLNKKFLPQPSAFS